MGIQIWLQTLMPRRRNEPKMKQNFIKSKNNEKSSNALKIMMKENFKVTDVGVIDTIPTSKKNGLIVVC